MDRETGDIAALFPWNPFDFLSDVALGLVWELTVVNVLALVDFGDEAIDDFHHQCGVLAQVEPLLGVLCDVEFKVLQINF
jgi:hypothetical protein